MRLTFKIVLDKRYKKGDSTYPLKVRIYCGSDYKEKSIDLFIREADWDSNAQTVASTCKEQEMYNAKVLSIKSKVQKQILLAELNDAGSVQPEDIIKAVFSVQVAAKVKVEKPCIIKYGEDVIKQLTGSGKVGNAFVYSCAVNKLKSYTGNTCAFEDLTYKRLTEFQDSMLAEQIKVNTISVYMRTIRAVFNRAIREGLIPATCYPFTAYRIKNEKTVNRTLTLKEMRSIAKLKLEPGTPIWHWRNYFLLSFCLIGVNFADMLTLTNGSIVDGRVVFRRKKTGKVYSIRLHPTAAEILSHYADEGTSSKDARLLPVLKQTTDPVKLKTDTWQAIKTCNEYLCRVAGQLLIDKDISTYYGRYTWANIARGLGYSKDVIGQALGHSYGNATTSIYLDDYDNGIIDAANAKVIAVVFK